MFKPLSLFLGLRYVRSRHGNGFSSFISASSTLGIALGVLVLIVVLSAMNGFERELAQRLLSVVPHGELIAVNEPIEPWPDSVKKVLRHPEVIAAAPVIKMNGIMQHAGQLKGVEIRGVDVQLETQVSSIEQLMIAGHWQDLTDKSLAGVIIGAGIAKKLKLVVGAKVQLLLPQPSIAEQGKGHRQVFSAPIKRNVTVVGIFQFGGVIDDTLAYMSLTQASDIMGYKLGQVQAVRLKVKQVFDAARIVKEVAYDFDAYVYMDNWTRTQGHVFNDIRLVRLVMFVVLVLVIAVASFNIVSTLIMAVHDKKGDIAILKTMGASTTTIMVTFVLQGLVNGVLGCFLGGVLGVLIALNLTEIMQFLEALFNASFLSADVYFIDYIPSQVNKLDVYITLITALVMSLLATLYPAWRATKVEPAQVLGQL